MAEKKRPAGKANPPATPAPRPVKGRSAKPPGSRMAATPADEAREKLDRLSKPDTTTPVPKPDAPRLVAAKGATRLVSPRSAPPNVAAPKPPAVTVQAAQPEPAKSETPKPPALTAKTPASETAKSETPKARTSKLDTPKAATPKKPAAPKRTAPKREPRKAPVPTPARAELAAAPEASRAELPAAPAASRAELPASPEPARAARPATREIPQPQAAERPPEPKAAPRATPTPAEEPLSILMVASEAHPYAKTGGLAEVAAALPDALARLGHTVTIVMPRYRGIDTAGATARPATIDMGRGRTQDVTFMTREQKPGVTFVFVDAPALYDRDGLYNSGGSDYPDNAFRFAVLSRAALEYARLLGERPSVIHAHDWQTGLVPVYQKMHFSPDPIVGGVPVVFTIHNIAFQGTFPPTALDQIGLDWNVFNVEGMEFWGQISYLKAGINFSERITTVSPTYAREILTPQFGFGMEGVLTRRAASLSGIVNGIDTDRWNPEKDQFLPSPFSAGDLSGKTAAKRALLEAVGLPVDDPAMARPVIGIVSRLTDQKGFDLVAAAAGDLMGADAAWVMLGSGEYHYEEMWRRLAARHPNRVSATIGFDERLAHLIEGGSDMFLMPSRFEPCGLNQMYSLRYGTVPVVRATGGLEDTVIDVSPGGGTGVKFHDYTPEALLGALGRALEIFRQPAQWMNVQRAGMGRDFSWDASAREYVKVYRAR